MPHSYRVTVERLPSAPTDDAARRLQFDCTNHDEIIALVDRVRGLAIVPEAEAAAFTIGLKIFGEVLLDHRADPPFSELFPHFIAFMKRIKRGASPMAGMAPSDDNARPVPTK